MSLFSRKAFLESASICIQAKRFRGKINLRKPQKPHFEKARLLAVTKPYIIKPKPIETIDLCQRDKKIYNTTVDNHPLLTIYGRELYEKFVNAKMIIFYHKNPIPADQEYKAYVLFHREQMELINYGKQIMEKALKGTIYESVLDFYVSHNMMVFSPQADIKKVLRINKKFPQFVMLAGIIDGRFVSKDELIYYSTIPNIQTAQAQLVQTLNSIGGTIVSQLNVHQNTLVSQLSERIKQLEVDKKE